MALVELIRGQATSDDSMAIARDLCETLGKTAVEAADYPGFIANRVLMPMINEAIFARDGRRRHAGGDRHGDEARHESPDGPARRWPTSSASTCAWRSSTCSTTASATRSTGRARSSAGWWLPGSWGGKHNAGSTNMCR